MTVLARCKRSSVAIMSLAVISTMGMTGVASATARVQEAKAQTQTQKQSTAAAAERLQAVIKDGDAKIAKRQADLVGLSLSVSQSKRLSEANRLALLTEVRTTTDGLASLKAKLDSATTLSEAKAARQSVTADYRVYMLVVPKVRLVKSADGQLMKQDKLLAYAKLLRTKTDARVINKSAVTAQIDQMTTIITNAQKLSSGAEASVAGLKPSDYNANRAVLQQAQTDIKAAMVKNAEAYNLGQEIQKTIKPARR